MSFHTKTKHPSSVSCSCSEQRMCVLSCVAARLNPLAVYWRVNLSGEWETLVTTLICYIPQMEKCTNIIGTCSYAAPANKNRKLQPCVSTRFGISRTKYLISAFNSQAYAYTLHQHLDKVYKIKAAQLRWWRLKLIFFWSASTQLVMLCGKEKVGVKAFSLCTANHFCVTCARQFLLITFLEAILSL